MPEATETVKGREVPAWLFENIAELSKHARTLHTIQVGFLIYCAFTVLTTPDRKIILDEQARLPIINLDVPFSGFVLAAPIVAIFIFLDFQIHLQALKTSINRARTEYAPLEPGRLYPWFGNLAEEPEPGLLGAIERLLATLSLWWLMPIVLIIVTTFTFKKHNTALGAIEWAISFVGTCLVLWLWHRYESGYVKRQKREASFWKLLEGWADALIRNWKKALFGAVVFIIHFILLLMISEENKIRLGWFSVDLSNQALVREQKDDAAGYSVDLRKIHLDGANLYGSVLTRADLGDAQLQRANLQRASLDGANLAGAKLSGARLIEAKLQLAHLVAADLRLTNLNCAKLMQADFLHADLSGAFLVEADLSGARNLSADQLSKAASLYHAKLDKELNDQIARSHPELLAEPPSEECVIKKYPPSTIVMRPVEFNEYPTSATSSEESKNEVTVLSDTEVLVLEKSGSDSHLTLVRFTHVREKEGSASKSQDYLRRKYLTPQITIPCYSDTTPTANCN